MPLFGDDFRQNEDATNWIRIGEVSSVDPKTCTARVVFDDEDGFISNDLPVIQRNTQSTKDYWLPAVGEDVICVFLPCGEEDGFILGSFYADEIKPPVDSETKRYLEFPDESTIEYDWNAHKLKAVIGDTVIEATAAAVQVSGASKVKVTVPDIEFVGNLKVDGDITTTGGVDADGEVTAMKKTKNVNLSTHIHPTAVGPSSPPTPGT
jgi:phage baseplate assembly protein V